MWWLNECHPEVVKLCCMYCLYWSACRVSDWCSSVSREKCVNILCITADNVRVTSRQKSSTWQGDFTIEVLRSRKINPLTGSRNWGRWWLRARGTCWGCWISDGDGEVVDAHSTNKLKARDGKWCDDWLTEKVCPCASTFGTSDQLMRNSRRWQLHIMREHVWVDEK